LGENRLKGFDDPVTALAVRQQAEEPPARPGSQRIESAVTLAPPDKPSVAVLPFANMSGDPEQEYFADGITEDIITELSRFRSLFVIARNSSFIFKGQSVDVTEVGEKLGVAYVVEGSVRKVGNRVRVTAQLVESYTGNHIWAERYDRELKDIFALQDELVQTITSTVGGRVEFDGVARAERMSEASLLAYDHVLRAKAAYLRSTKADNKYAREQLEQAIELDPRSAQAYRELAEVLVMDWMAHWVEDRDATLNLAFDCAKTAVRLDATYSVALATLGSIKFYCREFDDAQHDLERALELNPNDAQTLDLYALYLVGVGRTDEALAQHALSMRNNPFQPFWAAWLRGMALFTAKRYDEAIVTLRPIEDSVNEVRGWLAASYAGAGRLLEARDMLEEFLHVAEDEMVVFPGRSVAAWEDYWHGAVQYQDEADFEHLYDALRKAGLEG
jgi:TolB-like protein/Tfp pilus assembly protein PilF